MASATDSGRE